MSIGNNIYKLRTAKNLSQGELADILDVSRQSVSKWETDAAVPDLDKLMKLCDVFDVSLDNLTGRETPPSALIEVDKPELKTSSAQKIIGYILFAFSLVLGLIAIIFGHNEGDYLILVPIALSSLVCGLLCLFAGRKAFYWCLWTVFAPISILSPHVVGLPVLTTLSMIMIAVIIIMLFVANAVFRDTVVTTTPKQTFLLVLSWLLPIGTYAFEICIHTRPMPPYIAYNAIFSMLLGLVCYILIAVLETYTICYIKSAKRKNK